MFRLFSFICIGFNTKSWNISINLFQIIFILSRCARKPEAANPASGSDAPPRREQGGTDDVAVLFIPSVATSRRESDDVIEFSHVFRAFPVLPAGEQGRGQHHFSQVS